MIKLEEIEAAIKKEQEKYSVPFERDEGYEMCRDYVENNHLVKAEHLLTIDIWECLKCLIYLRSNKEISVEDCDRVIEKAKLIFEHKRFHSFIRVLDMMFIVADSDDYEEIIDYFRESSVLSMVQLAELKEPKQSIAKRTENDLEDEKYKTYLKELREIELDTGNLVDIIEFIREHNEVAAIVFGFLKARKRMEEDQRDINASLESFGHIRAKDLNRAITQYYSACYSTPNITRQHSIIKEFVQEEEQKEVVHDKDNQRATRMYNKTIELLRRAEKEEEIKNARELIRSVPNETIKKMILRWVYEHNQVYYEKLEERLEELSANSINHYLSILAKYGLSIPIQDVMTIMHHNPEEIEEIIQFLAQANLAREELIMVLKKTTKSIADRIKKYSNMGYITPSKIVEHISIYYQGDMKLEMMDRSIEMIHSQGINPKIFRDHPEYFWRNHELLERNLSFITTYGLAKNLKNVETYDFLLEENLEEKIDMLIELGFYRFLEENLELLNYSKDRLKRLLLLKQMNIPVEDMTTLEEVLDNSKFIVSDKDLDHYIMDYAAYKKENEIPMVSLNVRELEGDKVSINLGGNIISLPKIKRQQEQGKSMWEAIFYGKKVTEEEYKQIMSVLKPTSDYTNS